MGSPTKGPRFVMAQPPCVWNLGFAAGRNSNSEEERSHAGLQEREKKLFYPQQLVQKQEKQNNGFCEAC